MRNGVCVASVGWICQWRIFSVQHYIYARLIDLSAEALIDVQVCVAFMGADGI